MTEQLFQDLHQLPQLLESILRESTHFLADIDQRETSTRFTPSTDFSLPDSGWGGKETLKKFQQIFEQTIVGSSGPRYWGYVVGGTTPAALMGDWLASVYDQNTQSVKGEGDVSAVIERHTIRLLLDLFQLPHDFLGGFVTGATMSNFTCLAVARQWYGQQSGKDFAKEGLSGKIPVLAATPHSSALKSLAMLGIGSSNVITVNTLSGNREALDPADLRQKIAALQGQPFILLSSGGTVNTVDYDDFQAIAALKKQYTFWWHVDAAFGGFAACSTAHQHLLKGWEQADSITVDCHKWLNVPYESAIFLVREEYAHQQIATFQNSNAPYLGDPMENFSYLNLLPENSRRLKALPAWFTLMAYGRDGYREIVDRCITVAQQFGQYIDHSSDFSLLAPVRLNTVCFTLHEEKAGLTVSEFLTALNQTGKVFMTPTLYQGKPGIRAAMVNWRTTSNDVELVIQEMEKVIKQS